MDLKQLQYFISVADSGSFSKAASALAIAQSALSRQIALLEEEFEQKLLYRHGRGVRLNDAGKALYAHARGILEQVSRAKEDLTQRQQQPVGKLVLGLPYSVSRRLSPPFVKAFTQAFPQARLAILDGSSDQILEWLVLGRVELGLVFNPGAMPGINTTMLVEDELCVITSKRSQWPGRRSGAGIPFRKAVSLPIIIPSPPHTLRLFIDQHVAQKHAELNVRVETDSISTIVELVRSQEGVAILPGSVAGAYGSNGDLTARRIIEPRLPFSLQLAVYRYRPLTLLARRSAELLTSLVPQVVTSSARSSRP